MASRLSAAMDRTGQWVLSQEFPTDIVVAVGEATFPLHKFMLLAKSGYIRRKILESEQSDVARIDLSEVPGGAEAFERAAKFCYGVNFEISVHNVAALRCAAEYLEMTDEFCERNLAGRVEEFLAQAALRTLPAAVIVLRSCEGLLPLAEEIGIVRSCVDAIGLKTCNESNFPTRSPPEWWAGELATLAPAFFQKTIAAMRARGAAPKALAAAVSAYAEKSLPDLLPAARSSSSSAAAAARARLESIVALLPSDREAPLPVGFLCCLLRAAIALDASAAARRELERRVAAALDQAAVGDLLAVALGCAGERVVDLESVRRILALFVEREAAGGGVLYGGGSVGCSAAMQKVARTVDAFSSEIATDESLSVTKFAGIAGALPKSARRLDDDLYRAVDIYLKVHAELDEIEREKACSVMDPLKLSYEARLHASQNKRLPLQIVLHALYYDQLKIRSGSGSAVDEPAGVSARARADADVQLMRENEKLRSELAKMKMYVSGMQRGQGSAPEPAKVPKKPKFFSSVSRTLGKLISFKQGSKDTSNIEDDEEKVDVTKPRRRRFSLS